jgi:hypothetical protein
MFKRNLKEMYYFFITMFMKKPLLNTDKITKKLIKKRAYYNILIGCSFNYNFFNIYRLYLINGNFTCEYCEHVIECVFAYDFYNTNGDCLNK